MISSKGIHNFIIIIIIIIIIIVLLVYYAKVLNDEWWMDGLIEHNLDNEMAACLVGRV